MLYQKYFSNKQTQGYILNIALTYQNAPEIYFPIRLDNRGRMYPIPYYLNYQSTELAKALLQFNKGDTIDRSDIESIYFLKAYGASVYGLGEVSYDEKNKWVDGNWDKIIDFESNVSWYKKAEDKYLFLAFCLEIRRLNLFLYRSTEPKFTTYLPIQLDGTCNKFKHLALLSNDVDIFEHLNLDNKGKDRNPSDFFSFFLEKMNIFISLQYKEETDVVKKERWKRLKNLGLSRKNLKPANAFTL